MTENKKLLRELLERSHLFKTLDEDGRNRFEEMGHVFQVPAGEIIIEEGTEGDSFYVLLSGLVTVHSEKDGRKVKLAELSQGAVLGEVALLTGEPRTATVTASSPATLARFPEDGIRDILGRYPKVKELLVRVLVHRAKDTIEKMYSTLSVS